MPKKLTLLVLLLFILALTPALSLAQDGAATFKAKCSMCHGPDGSGKTAMARN